MKIGLAELAASAGRQVGPSDWLTIEQERVDGFADATGSGDYLALSLTNYFLPQLLEVTGITSGVNYGADSARFGVAPRAGDRLRATAEIVTVTEIEGGLQTLIRITVEVAGGHDPACVVDSVSRWLA